MKYRKIAIIYRYTPQYRQRFYTLLKERLSQTGIELLLIYGQAGPADAKKKDAIDLEWGIHIPSKIFTIGRHEFYWQPILSTIKDVDLIVVEQANKLLINYLLTVQNMLGIRKLAYWGHGRNFQATSSNRFSESLKSILATKVHWWFAYNQLSADIVYKYGYPKERTTVIQNAIDTRELIAGFQALNPKSLELIRQRLGIRSKRVGLYVGAMYSDKGLGFLLDACFHVKKLVPDFEMIFIGSGADAYLVEERARNNDWIHYVGSCFDQEKIPYFAVSSLFLLPKAVGLAILDSFALEVPLVTTIATNHGPEIQYLENGVNGLLVENADDPKVYGKAVADLLNDEARRNRLVEGCRAARDFYTVEAMVENFAQGIQTALGN